MQNLGSKHHTLIQALLSHGPLKEKEFHSIFAFVTGKNPGCSFPLSGETQGRWLFVYSYKSKMFNYNDLVKRVASYLRLGDSTKTRLTYHIGHPLQPQSQPIKYESGSQHASETCDVIYYEVLDTPLPDLQGVKTLNVTFCHATKDEVLIRSVTLPIHSNIADVINDLKGLTKSRQSRDALMCLVLVVAVLVLSLSPIQHVAVEGASEDLELDAQLKNLNTTPIKTIHTLAEACPKETVPILRTQKEDLIRAKSLPPRTSVDTSNRNKTQYLGGYVYESVGETYYGAGAVIDIYNPNVVQGQFSKAAIALEGGPVDKSNGINFGWMVNPNLYGDNLTRLFTYWTLSDKSLNFKNSLQSYLANFTKYFLLVLNDGEITKAANQYSNRFSNKNKHGDPDYI